MRNSLFLIIFTMNSRFINSQIPKGKWILKDISSENLNPGYPGFQLLEVKDSTANFHTDFSLKNNNINLKVLSDRLVTLNHVEFAKYKTIDNNLLEIFVKGKSNNIDVIFKSKFYKIEPTITVLEIEDIEKIKYIFHENGRDKELIFNKELTDKLYLSLLK